MSEVQEPAAPDAVAEGADRPAEDEQPADESYLLGRTGVEDEVLAESARAAAELQDPSIAGPAGPDDSGAVV